MAPVDHMLLAHAAKHYSELGWALVQLDGKMPIGHGWHKSLPLDPVSAVEIWKQRQTNMGIVLGPSGVIDYELDSGGDPARYWDLVGGDYPDTPVFMTGSGKPHCLFRDPGGLSRRTREGLELRAGHHQSVLPPSIHPDTGKPYEWVNDPTQVPLADPPKALLEFFADRPGEAHENNWRNPMQAGKKLGKGEGRHETTISFLGKMVNVVDDADQLAGAAIAYAQLTQDPPYDDGTLIDWAYRVWDSYREEPLETSEAEQYLKLVTADKIQMRSVEFLWKPFIQRSAFHLLVGRKGAGKGSVLTWMAAQMTSGADWGDPRAVLWIATEDSFEIDVKPRFIAQGGDEKMLLCVQQRVRLPEDISAIDAVCREWNVGMVVIDPIVGVIGNTDSNAEGPIVDAIGGLNQLADELDLSVIGVRHLGKRIEGGMLEAVLGSAAWVNTPRAVIGIAQEHDTKTVTMEILAGNRVRNQSSFDFDLQEATVPGVAEPVSLVVPKGLSNTSMEDVLSGRRESKIPEVKEWLVELMEDYTPISIDSLTDECLEKFGVGARTISRAARDLRDEGKLKWIPPAKDPETGQFAPGGKWYFQRP